MPTTNEAVQYLMENGCVKPFLPRSATLVELLLLLPRDGTECEHLFIWNKERVYAELENIIVHIFKITEEACAGTNQVRTCSLALISLDSSAQFSRMMQALYKPDTEICTVINGDA